MPKKPRMDNCGDFIQHLGLDMSIEILMHLDDPSDLVHVCSVSKSWREFVIANDLCKQLCLKILPEMSSIAHVIELNNTIEPVTVRESRCLEWECLRRNHRVYAFLARAINTFMRQDCISEAITASSTDNYPEESIQNTLEPNDGVEHRASYWSSKGESDPAVPEILVYKLMANMCLVTEIHVQPFEAYFQNGFPIYSSKAVRFRMGHPKFPAELQNDMTDKSAAAHKLADDKLIWTYTSPEFPMAQENYLQKFKLPEPVLCIGGILQVELLGRVQRQEMDGLYYICISHVQVVGRPLLPPFDVEILDSTGKCTLKYYSETPCCVSSTGTPKGETGAPSRLCSFTARLMQRGVRGWEQMIMKTLLGTGAVVRDDESDDELPAWT